VRIVEFSPYEDTIETTTELIPNPSISSVLLGENAAEQTPTDTPTTEYRPSSKYHEWSDSDSSTSETSETSSYDLFDTSEYEYLKDLIELRHTEGSPLSSVTQNSDDTSRVTGRNISEESDDGATSTNEALDNSRIVSEVEDQLRELSLGDYSTHESYINSSSSEVQLCADPPEQHINTDMVSLSSSLTELDSEEEISLDDVWRTLPHLTRMSASSTSWSSNESTLRSTHKVYRPARFLGKVCDISKDVEDYEDLVEFRKPHFKKDKPWYTKLFHVFKHKDAKSSYQFGRFQEEVVRWCKKIDPEKFDDVLDYREQLSKQNAFINSFL
jgi:hypothetical protein